MALQPLSPPLKGPLPIPPPPSPSPSGGVGGVGQARGGRHTPTEDLSPRLLLDGKGSGCRPLLMKEGGISDEGSPARPGRGGEWGEPWPCCKVRHENSFVLQNFRKEGSREPSPAPDCLQRKIEALRAHPTEIFNFMVVSGTPRLGKAGHVVSTRGRNVMGDEKEGGMSWEMKTNAKLGDELSWR